MTKTLSRDEMIAHHKSFMRDDGTILKAARSAPSWDREKRSARFVMTAQVRDRDGDVILVDGIDLDNFQKNPIALWQHRADYPTGTWSDLEKILTGRPKRMEGTHNFMGEGVDEYADRAARLMDAGIIKTASIGFMIDWNEVEYEYDEAERKGTFMFRRTELVECSLVSIPANAAALAKAAEPDRKMARDLIEEVLDGWARTPEGLLVPREDFEKAYRIVSGEKTAVVVEASEEEAAAHDVDVAAKSAERIEDTLFARLAKRFGLLKEPPPPAPIDEHERAKALALAAAVEARVKALKAA